MSAFDDPLFLVNQARNNIAEFETICERFFAENIGRQRIDIDPETGNKTFKFVFEANLPERGRHICNTCIGDMRHALDQAACIAFESITGTEAPDKLYFPITTHPNDLIGRLTQFFPPELHPVFKRLEPYPTSARYPGGTDLLCDLSSAAQNKHRLVPKIGGRIISASGPIKAEEIIWLNPRPVWDIANNELVFGTTRPNGYIDANINISFYIAFYQAGPLSGRPANSTLREITDMVERFVSEVAAETARITS